MVLRFQRVTPIVSPQRMRPDELGVTQGLQAPHRRGITAPSLSIFAMKPLVPPAGTGKAFLECVRACVRSLGFQLTPKATWRGGGGCHATPISCASVWVG